MRIGIVNDSPLAREALRRAVAQAPAHRVAWLAIDGRDAVARAVADRPDLILMDLIMPGLDGVEATRQIMERAPCPILIVTASLSSNQPRVYEAMSLGALDVVATPSSLSTVDAAGDGVSPLMAKIATVAKYIGRAPRPPRDAAMVASSGDIPIFDTSPVSWSLVVLGASTGGPGAVVRVLADLPDSPDSAVVIIQHIDAAFAPGLAREIGDRTGRRVDLTTPGDRPLPGRVYLAATNDHLILDRSQRFRHVCEPETNHYRPSVDVFAASLVRNWPEPGAAAILTGMGRDGASGLLALRLAGWFTVAQDEASSVVYGMPRAAAEAGAAHRVLPLHEIGAALGDRGRDRSYRIPGVPRR